MAHMNVQVLAPAAVVVWANQPALATELLGLTIHRKAVDLSDFAEFRLIGNIGAVAANAGATAYAEYSILGDFTDNVGLDGTGGGGAAEIAMDAAGCIIGAWTAIDAAAIADGDVSLRIMGLGGDGAVDPELGAFNIEFR